MGGQRGVGKEGRARDGGERDERFHVRGKISGERMDVQNINGKKKGCRIIVASRREIRLPRKNSFVSKKGALATAEDLEGREQGRTTQPYRCDRGGSRYLVI